jgi:hypothetical protein
MPAARGRRHAARDDGQPQSAATEFTNAVVIAVSRGLSTELKVGVVHSCLNAELDAQASELMINLMNDTDSGVSMDDAVQVFERAGRHDLAEGMTRKSSIRWKS